MKVFVVLFLFVFSVTVYSQSVEFYGGANNNNFFTLADEGGHESYSSDSQWGYSLGVAYENLDMEPLNLRLTLGFENYNGHLTYTNGGLGGSFTTDADVTKSVITLGFYPVNIQIKNRLNLNFGLLFSGLVYEKETGSVSGWSIIDGGFSREINETNQGFSPFFQIGFSARIAYDFALNESWYLLPQYRFYVGFLNDFTGSPFNSIRHFVGVGLKRNLN